MNDFTFIFYSMRARLFNCFLSIFLTAFGVSLAIMIIQIGNNISNRINADGKNIDLVVGAKGSPLQLVLSSIYHIDIPNGNIPFAKAQNIMEHPQIKNSIPLALGDNWNGYRIVGTNYDYLELYDAKIEKGRLWNKEFEIVAGASIEIDLNSEIIGSHGLTGSGVSHENEKYKVVGFLERTGTVLDRLLLTDINSVLEIHGHQKIEISHESKGKKNHVNHDDHHGNKIDSHKNHHHEHSKHNEENGGHNNIREENSQEITSLIIQTKSPIANVNLPNLINKDSELLVANPAMEIVRLSAILGFGSNSLGVISLILIIISILSIFAGLAGNLESRMSDLAILRALGYTKFRIFKILSLEGTLLVIFGLILGLLFSLGGLKVLTEFLNPLNEMKIKFQLEIKTLCVLLTVFLFGFLASLIPAFKNSKLSVANQLSRNI